MTHFLDFERPIEELVNQLEEAKAIAEKSQVDMSKAIKELEHRITKPVKTFTAILVHGSVYKCRVTPTVLTPLPISIT
jgi:acetyl-CoA carboxylase alpha subunit